MLLFVDLECVTRRPVQAPQAPHGGAIERLCQVLQRWPDWRLVWTGAHGHATGHEGRRLDLPVALQRRVIGSTRRPGDLAGAGATRREDDILDWLWGAGIDDVPWLALDDRVDDFDRHPDRLVVCDGFTEHTAADLQRRLDRWASTTWPQVPQATAHWPPAWLEGGAGRVSTRRY